MNLEELFAEPAVAEIPDGDAVHTAEIRPEEGYRAATLFDSFPGLLPFA